MSERPERCALPNGEVIWFRPIEHSYWQEFDEDTGKCSGRIPGMSTIAKALPEDPRWLMRWAARENGTGIAMLAGEALGLKDVEKMRSALSWLGSADAIWRELERCELTYDQLRDRRARQGTNIHERVFAALARGEVPSLADVAPDERAFGQAAIRFWREHNPDPVVVEQVVYAPSIGAAGRFDLLADDGDELVVWDAKTAKAPVDGRERFVNLAHHTQLAGYVRACAESGFGEPSRARLLYLLDDGSYEIEDCAAGAEDFEVALAAYHAAKRVKKAASQARKQRQEVLAA